MTLADLARRTPSRDPVPKETCELCGNPLEPEHRHVADLQAQSLLCACRACVVLLSRPGAGGGHYRLVPERRLLLEGFRLGEEQWASLGLPVELAFFFRSSAAGRVVALYPSPAGATESQLSLDAWDELERENPVLRGLEPDVEALLVDRTAGSPEHFLVPIDDCYSLVALIRTRWRGLAGGAEVKREVAAFFDRLRAGATVATHEPREVG
jgi:Family of unknown function (DUF5947)